MGCLFDAFQRISENPSTAGGLSTTQHSEAREKHPRCYHSFGSKEEGEPEAVLTKKICCALVLAALVFRLPSVISFSAMRCVSLALGHVVVMDSCSIKDVTRLRSNACRCDDFRLRCLYLGALPAIVLRRRKSYSVLVTE